jgi:FixJ family two-component response regulator
MKLRNCVCIVDDDPSPRNGFRRLFLAAGMDALAFPSGEELLERLDREPMDVGCLILDARMLGMSASDLHKSLQARGVSAPRIVVTADDCPDTRLIAKDINASSFFSKPVDANALLDAVRWAMESARNGERPKPQSLEKDDN